jgi:site-specific recombinase XerD
MKKYSLGFGIRSDRPNQNGEAAVFLRYSYDRKFVNLPLGVTIPISQWSSDTASPKRTYEDFSKLRSQMNSFEDFYLEKISSFFSSTNRYPTVIEIKSFKAGSIENTPDIKMERLRVDSLFKEYITNAQRNNLSKSTIAIYGYARDKWLKFASGKYYYVTEMNLNVLKDFRIFLNEQGLRENTVGKYIKTIKSFLNYCYFTLELTEIPISFHKMEVDKEHGAEIIHLTQDELEVLKREVFYSGWYGTPKYDLTEREKLIGQIFVFLCSTGLSYVDFNNIRLHHINVANDNLKKKRYITLEVNRQKLKSIHKSIIPIVDVTIDLLIEWIVIDRMLYSFDSIDFEQKKSFLEKMLNQIQEGKVKKPFHPRFVQYIPSQTFNKEIKDVLRKIKLTRKVNILWRQANKKNESVLELCDAVSSHTGRRTYVTLSLEQGISLHHLMQSTGHTKTATLLKYNKTSRESVSREFEEKVANRSPEKSE